MTRTLRLVSLILALVFLVMGTAPEIAAADYSGLSNGVLPAGLTANSYNGVMPQCAVGYSLLGNMNWESKIQASTGGGTSGSGFSRANSSYVLMGSINNGAENTTNQAFFADHGGSYPVGDELNRYELLYSSDDSQKLQLGSDATGAYIYATSGTLISASMTAEPNTDAAYKNVWTGSYSSNQYEAHINGSFTYTNNKRYISSSGGTVFNYGCQGAAHNVNYSASWGYSQWNNDAPIGSGSGTSCGALDLGCWVRKGFDGLSSGLSGLWQDMLYGIGQIFGIDSAQLSSDWSSFSSFMNAKLGVLAYPFTFLGNLFAAFTTDTSGCNATSCVKNFGNFFGSNFSINLALVASAWPTWWAWIVGVIRGVTVLAIILGVRRKFLESAKA